ADRIRPQNPFGPEVHTKMITTLSIAACSLTMLISSLVSQGRLKAVFYLSFVNNGCFIVINAALPIGGHSGVRFFVLPAAWGIGTGHRTLRRRARDNVYNSFSR